MGTRHEVWREGDMTTDHERMFLKTAPISREFFLLDLSKYISSRNWVEAFPRAIKHIWSFVLRTCLWNNRLKDSKFVPSPLQHKPPETLTSMPTNTVRTKWYPSASACARLFPAYSSSLNNYFKTFRKIRNMCPNFIRHLVTMLFWSFE